MIWEGTVNGFEKFLEYMISNEYGLTFSGIWNNTQVNFFSLTLLKENYMIFNKNIF